MSNPVRWGVLGAASIAVGRTIPAMQAAQGAHVLAIASRDGDKARSAALRLGIERSYGSYEALLADPDIEAVYIPLPNPLHVPWSLKALEAGNHVLCEKPIALTAAEASLLVEARDRRGLVVEEAFSFPNHPQWAFIRKTLDEGALGQLRAVTGVLAYNNTNPADEGPGRGSIPTRRVHFDAVNQYTAQTERFCRLVRGKKARAWPIEHAIGNMKVIDALFRSELSGTWEAP